eukprot:gene13612-biopygen2131
MESELLRQTTRWMAGGPHKRRQDSQATASDESARSTRSRGASTPPTRRHTSAGPCHRSFPRGGPPLRSGQLHRLADAERRRRGRLEVVQEMLAEGSRGMGQAHARGIAHLLVATGLLMVGDGKSRSLDVNSVGMRNYRLKKRQDPSRWPTPFGNRGNSGEITTRPSPFL